MHCAISPHNPLRRGAALGTLLAIAVTEPALSGTDESAAVAACEAISVATAVVPSTGPAEPGRLFVAGTAGTNGSGFVRAFSVDASTGEVIEDPGSWGASSRATQPDQRRVVTFDGRRGQPLRWDHLGEAQRERLGASASQTDTAAEQQGRRLLQWLRGGATPAQGLASRTTALGEIAHAVPAYLGPPDAPYPDHWGPDAPENTEPYSGFAAAQADRPPMLFVAANDGMLHAFDTAEGLERFAYVPGPVLAELPALADPASGRDDAVDGSPIIMDAYFDDTRQAWRTVLVGGLGAGGQGFYALDVTEIPSAGATEDAFASTVLWEFTDADDADLGFTFSEPNVVRLANGEWTVVVGNGYDNTLPDSHPSDSGSAVLYVLDIETGALLARVDTREGRREDPFGLGRANGLSTLAPMDADGDFVVDYVYGGDLFGNLWKFDLRASNPTEWRVAHDGYTSDPQPLFRARGNAGEASSAQAIVFRPQIVRRPGSADHFLVVFATGADHPEVTTTAGANAVQTVYAVLDRGEARPAEVTREHLLRQGIVPMTDDETEARRAITRLSLAWHRAPGLPLQSTSCADSDPTNDPADGCTYLGWYLDLPGDGETPVAAPRARGERLVFVTGERSRGNCVGGGWVHEVDLSTGGAVVPAFSEPSGGGPVDAPGFEPADDFANSPLGITTRPLSQPSAGLPVFLDGLPATGAGRDDDPGTEKPLPTPMPPGCAEIAYAPGADGIPESSTLSCGDREVGRLYWEELF